MDPLMIGAIGTLIVSISTGMATLAVGLKTRVETKSIQKQVHNNGGSSLKDSVDYIKEEMGNLRRDVSSVRTDLTHVRGDISDVRDEQKTLRTEKAADHRSILSTQVALHDRLYRLECGQKEES